MRSTGQRERCPRGALVRSIGDDARQLGPHSDDLISKMTAARFAVAHRGRVVGNPTNVFRAPDAIPAVVSDPTPIAATRSVHALRCQTEARARQFVLEACPHLQGSPE